jgi:serine protease Do
MTIGLLFSLASSWMTLSVTGQTVEEKAFNRTVHLQSGPGSCTGVILQTSLVLTASHCIHNERDITVAGKKAILLKRDKKADLALLLVETIIMERILVADIRVGDDVFTWGHPYGSPNRVFSKGYITVIQFGVTYSSNLACPGQSGSGLFDRNGNLVGIITEYMDGTNFSVNRTPGQIREFWKF